MPIYDYWCRRCGRIVSLYQRSFTVAPASCPHCGNTELKRIFSTFSVHRTYKDVYDDILSDRQLTEGMMHNDPRALAEWSRRMSSGEETPPEYEEITDRMERGEWPSAQIEEKRKELWGQAEATSGSL